jgi:hypothetical protein
VVVGTDAPPLADAAVPSTGKDAALADGVAPDVALSPDVPLAVDTAQAVDVAWARADSDAPSMDVVTTSDRGIDASPSDFPPSDSRPSDMPPSDGGAPIDGAARPLDTGRDLLTTFDAFPKKADLPPGAQSIPDYQAMQLADFPYQCFVKNWADDKYPVFFAVIQSATDFDAYFGPAGVMGPSKPYTPSASDFSKYSYLLVSRVVPAAPVQKTFAVEALMAGGTEVGLSYTYKQGSGSATSYSKEGMLVAFPKRKIDQVMVYENHVLLGILDAAAGKNDVTLNQ